MSELAKKIEALLFITAEELSFEYLSKVLGVSEETVKEEVTLIKENLDSHGLSIVVTDNNIKMTTSPVVSEFVAEYSKTESKDLSKAAAETLSLIAYRGPIAQHDISIIRGVDSKRIVTQLLRRGLIIKSKSNTEVSLYDVSIEFLQNLGLTKKEELPEFDKLSNSESIRRILTDAA